MWFRLLLKGGKIQKNHVLMFYPIKNAWALSIFTPVHNEADNTLDESDLDLSLFILFMSLNEMFLFPS